MRTMNEAILCLCLDLIQLLPLHMWEREFTASLPWEWCCLATVPRLLTSRFSVPPNTPWSSFSCPSHRVSQSLSSLHPLPSLQPPLCSHQVYFVMFHQPAKLLGLTTSLPKHNGKKHQLSWSALPNRMLYSAEKDPRTAAIDLKELGMDAMLPSSVICKKNQISPCYFNLTDNIIQPNHLPLLMF